MGSVNLSSRVWLAITPLFCYWMNITLALLAQSKWYWRGYFEFANEASPQGQFLMSAHPAAFVGAAALWGVILLIAMLKLPESLAKIVGMSLVIGHVGFGLSFLPHCIPAGYFIKVGVCILASVTLVMTWEQSAKVARE